MTDAQRFRKVEELIRKAQELAPESASVARHATALRGGMKHQESVTAEDDPGRWYRCLWKKVTT